MALRYARRVVGNMPVQRFRMAMNIDHQIRNQQISLNTIASARLLAQVLTRTTQELRSGQIREHLSL